MTIHLRKIEPTDLPFLYLWENDTNVWKDGDTHNPLSQQDLRNYIASTTGDIYQDGQLSLIIESETKDTLGCIDLYNLDNTLENKAMAHWHCNNYKSTHSHSST